MCASVELQIFLRERTDCDRTSCPLQLGVVLPGKGVLKLLPQGCCEIAQWWIIFGSFRHGRYFRIGTSEQYMHLVLGLATPQNPCAGYMGYPPSKLKVYLFSHLVL